MASGSCKVNDFQLREHHIVTTIIETGKREFWMKTEDDDAQQENNRAVNLSKYRYRYGQLPSKKKDKFICLAIYLENASKKGKNQNGKKK